MSPQQLDQIERAARRLEVENRRPTPHAVACRLNLSVSFVRRGVEELAAAGRWVWANPAAPGSIGDGEASDPPITPEELEARRVAVLLRRGVPIAPYDHARGATP